MAKKLKYSNNQKELIESGIDPELYGGLNGEADSLPKPKYIQTTGEKVITGLSSTRIVLGKDRKNVIGSGYGGSGDIGSGSIDIVAEPVLSLFNTKAEEQYCDPSFQYDAARIYLAGKTNIDEYFGVPDNEKITSGKSAVAMYADCSRIFARQDIRIVSGMSKTNAMGGVIYKTYNIQLVGNNDFSSLQPAVLGNNFVSFAKELLEVMDSFMALFDKFVLLQSKYNTALSQHYHYSPFFGNPTTPSETAMQSFVSVSPQIMSEMKTGLLALRNKMASLQTNYLSGIGGSSVLSEYVELN